MQPRRKVIPDAEQALVGGFIRRSRLKAGVSQGELGALFDMPQSFISKIERGERPLQFVEFLLVCRRLGLEPDQAVREYLESLPLLSSISETNRVKRKRQS